MQLLNFLFLFVVFSNPNDACKNKAIIGTWSYVGKAENVDQYKKTELLTTSSLFIFEAKGKVTMRSIINDGFCGTPPHNYRNTLGAWKINGSTLTITHEMVRTERDLNSVEVIKTQKKEESKPENNNTIITRKYKIIKLDNTEMHLQLL
jgi:hypothetical protein